MKVSFSLPTKRYIPPQGQGKASIEFAMPATDGNSSAGEKHGFTEKAVRLSWWNSSGGYDPISSAELPEWAAIDVIEACAANDFFSLKDAATLMVALAQSIERQSSEDTPS
jgi:hypothetical protein